MSTRTIAIGSIAAATLGSIGLGIAYAASEDSCASEPEAFVVEVADDAKRFAFDDTPFFDDGLPGYGNQSVTQGYIHEPGTLADGGSVNPDGSPTHPDAVTGTWTCEGVPIGDGAQTQVLESFNDTKESTSASPSKRLRAEGG